MLLLAPQRTAFLFCLFLLIILAADKQNQANADAADINHDGTDKIVGGTLAVRGEFPGYATPSGSNTLCGAYLIQNNILVTAAHCARAFDVYTVHIGGIQRSSKKEVGEETIAIDDVCVHPDYDEPTFQNDIMLIRLRKPSMKPLKEYYTSSMTVPSSGQVIGYGFTVSGGPVSSDLRKVDVSVLTDDVCTSFFGDYYNSSIMVCAGDPNKSACDGDSGGPLLDNHSPSKIMGIVSWGVRNRCERAPAVYTRISAFDAWIRENTASAKFVQCARFKRFKKTFCFSSRNTVEVQGKGIVPMDQLQTGDYVKAGNDRFSRVYSFSHLDMSMEATFLQIHMEQLDQPLEVSPDHIVYVSGGKTVRASDVRVGDRMDNDYLVSRITIVRRHGVYAPVTYSGNIVVSGVLASSYVSLLDNVSPGVQNRVAHLVTGVHRLICNISFSICEQETYLEGISSFLQPILGAVRLFNQWRRLYQIAMVVVVAPFLMPFAGANYFFLSFFSFLTVLLVLLSRRTPVKIVASFTLRASKSVQK